MSVRAVVFDLFDTLVDLHLEDLPRVDLGDRRVPSTLGRLHAEASRYAPLELDAFVAAMREVDRVSRETRYKEGREYPTLQRFQDLCTHLGIRDERLAEELTRAHMGAIAEQVRYLPRHVQLLERLRARGVATAVCSNFSHTPTGLAVIETSGLAPHLDAVVISEEVGLRKPRREIFEETLRRLGARADESLHVGDNLEADVHGAHEAGIGTVWVTRRVPDAEERLARHRGARPLHVVGDLEEVEPLL